MINRRNFLKNSSMVAAGGLLAGNVNVANAAIGSAAQAKKNFGLQTYSLTVNERNGDREFSTDVPNGLKKVAQMGYSHLELAGYGVRDGQARIGAVPIAEFKKYAGDAGLEIRSTHVGHTNYTRGRDNRQQELDHWKRAFDEHKAIGCKYVIQPGEPPMRNTADVAFIGDLYNEIGKIANAAGVKFAYHNHSGEFQRVAPGGQEKLPFGRFPYGRIPEDAKMIYDGLIEATDPSLVEFELDVYWAVMGMQDPVAYMKKYAKRIRVLHIKDVDVLGESGMMNFQKIFETAYANGISDFFVELESVPAGMTQFIGVKGCADYLLKAPFVK
ncbi:MAG: TIM barrel protein [Tannerella sp.]|nr:TIM barrel protein [Tannerella sp.]